MSASKAMPVTRSLKTVCARLCGSSTSSIGVSSLVPPPLAWGSLTCVQTHTHYTSNGLKKLMDEHPRHETSKDGQLFWSGARRWPSGYKQFIDPDDELHVELVGAMARILAVCFGVCGDPEAREGGKPTGKLLHTLSSDHPWRSKVGLCLCVCECVRVSH